MMIGSLSFAADDWLWPAAALFFAGLLAIWYSYFRSPLAPGYKAASFGLKTLGLGLLLLCLLEPMWTTTRPRDGANYFALVADNSIGLQVRDPGEEESRGEKLREFITSDQTEWQGKLEQTFMVRRYVFDSRLQSTRDFSELTLEGRASGIVSALESLGDRFQGQPLAGAFLFTDGNATDLPEGALNLAGLPPVYPVVLGSGERMLDLAVGKVSVNQTAFEDAPVTIQVTARASELRGQPVTARLVLDGETAAEQTATPGKAEEELSFRFQVKPEEAGISFYQLKLELDPATAALEATPHNNERTIPVDRGRGPYRILYVSGRPNWEFKFLNRAVAEDPEVQLVALIRVAKREPKFTFRGHAGESNNPLFRGFDETDEATEQYDQPVLVRLNTKDEFELKGGFPKAAEELYGYHAVIVDDLEAGFFTPDQMTLLQEYVSERGGGFLMLGGAESLREGDYNLTPVGEMLPVYLDRAPARRPSGRLRLDLHRDGWLQPWVRLRTTEDEERERLRALPEFQVLNPVREIKPGASLLATATDLQTGEKYPALVVQRFGGGRTAVLTIGDLFLSALRSEKMNADLGKWWRQVMRWLVADVPPQIELRAVPKSGDPDGAMRLVVQARNKKFQPMENAAVKVTVRSLGEGGTNEITLRAEPSETEAGAYEAVYIPRATGAYRASAEVIDSEGIKAGEADAGWASEPLAREFASLAPNRAFLEEIAQRTGGEVIEMAEVPRVVDSLPEREAPVVETYSYPLWHRNSVFLLALGCFAAEWGMRRWKGLA